MKTLTHICMGLLASAGMVAPAFGQTVTPANYRFTGVGPAQLVKGSTVLNCQLTLVGDSGADVGGNRATGGVIDVGTNTGPGACPLVRVETGDFVITSYDPVTDTGTGELSNLAVSLGGSPSCAGAGPYPFTIANTGTGTSIIDFSATITNLTPPPATCDVSASLEVDLEVGS